MQSDIIVIVKKNLEILLRADGCVVITLRAFVIIVVELFGRAGFLAFFALEPDTFRHIFFCLGGGGDAFAQAFVPTHETVV